MRLILILSLLSMTSCMVGPRYCEPQIDLPTAFEENCQNNSCSDEDLCRWWKQFDDPLLDAFVAETAQNNFDVRIALEKIIEARAQYQIQSSFLWPEIDLNAVATRNRFSQNVFTSASSAESISDGNPANGTRGSVFGPPVQNFFQIGFDAIWELDFWGKFRHGQRAAYDEWEAIRFNAQSVLLTAISEVVRDYVSIRSLQQQIDILQKKIHTDERNLELALVLFHAGLDNQIDVERLTAALENERATLPLLETACKQTIYSLAVLLGKQPECLISQFEEKKPIPKGSGKVPAGLPSDLLRRRPDVREAERQLAAATEKIGIAVADYFPHISLTGNGYGYESNKPNNWIIPNSSYWSIGPSINWNLIDFGRTRGLVAAANSAQKQALLAYEKIVVSSLQDVEGALIAYFDEQKRNHSLFDQLIANRKSLELTEDLFQAGLAAEPEVLDALKAVLDTEATLLKSDQALTNDLVALYKALGGDWDCSPTP